jgi:hypothetical protein
VWCKLKPLIAHYARVYPMMHWNITFLLVHLEGYYVELYIMKLHVVES